MFDRGSGPPLVVVPGLQGRWEWAKPALVEVSKRCRTISYSLCGDFGSGTKADPELGMENYLKQLDAVLDRVGLERTAVCGISFGGLVALRYAATRPGRVSALVLESAPGPRWSPTPTQSRWLARPWLSAPVFALSAPFRLWAEISAALPRLGPRLRFMVVQGFRVLRAPAIPSLMAQRIRDARATDFEEDCARVQSPTLVVTGEEGLDAVVPVAGTRMYASLIKGAGYVVMNGTGHLGQVTQPWRFAQIVGDFVHAHRH